LEGPGGNRKKGNNDIVILVQAEKIWGSGRNSLTLF